MLEELRRRALSGLRTKLIIYLSIIAVFMLITKGSIIDCIRGPIDLNQNYDWDTKELDGKYVTLDVDFVNIKFAERSSLTSNSSVDSVTSNYYICEIYVPKENINFLYAVKVDNTVSEELMKVYNTDGSYGPVKLTGTFTKMTGLMLEYYKDTVEGEFGVSDYLDYSIPYCIYDDTIKGIDTPIAYLLYGVIFLVLIVMVITAVNYLRGNSDRFIKKFLATNQRETIQGIESDYNGAIQIHKDYRLGKKYLFYPKGFTMKLLPMQYQVWAYHYKTNGRNDTSQIRMFDINRKMELINISERLAKEVLDRIREHFDYMIVGYDNSLEKMFENDFTAFLNLKYNEAKSAAARDAGWNL